MPIPSLRVTVRATYFSIDRLAGYRRASSSLSPLFQHLISELILLRLFAVLEQSIEEIACKLVAGATYMNGSSPVRHFNARSVASARAEIFDKRRNKGRAFLTWTRASDIQENVSPVLSPSDPFVHFALAHAAILDEIRKVRNCTAHNSSKAKQEFRGLLRTAYGANISLSTGAFLTSTKRYNPAKIDEYLVVVKSITSDLSTG